MTAGDLYAITQLADINPRILPHLIMIYKMGYKQAYIDRLRSEANALTHWGINLGNEMKGSN